MEQLIKTVETFLAYSEEKLEELAEKNHRLKERPEKDFTNKDINL